MVDSLIRAGSAPIDPGLCGKIVGLYEPLWVLSLMAPEVAEDFDRLGLPMMDRYFAARVAPLGAVPPAMVVSTFFNFSPAAVAGLPQVWERFTPGQVLDTQRSAMARALERTLGSVDAQIIAQARALLTQAAEAAAARPEGRPLFAAYASLPWPEEPLLALWHAHYLLREFRGDGHIAVLVEHGLTGLEALILHIAVTPELGPIFRPSRRWTDDEWDGALARLRADDWLTGDDTPTLTAAGRERRRRIEQRTNELNVPAFAAIGTDGCERLLELGAPIVEAIAPGVRSFGLIPAEV